MEKKKSARYWGRFRRLALHVYAMLEGLKVVHDEWGMRVSATPGVFTLLTLPLTDPHISASWGSVLIREINQA